MEISMKLQKLLSYTRKAIDDFQMIQPNDVIAVGVSGGKDSLTLLYALANLRKFYPNPFTIKAITVHLGMPDMDFTKVKELCEQLDVEYEIVDTQIFDIVFEHRKETNPCSLCAKMRKGALNQKIKELGCNKIAYAHHKDDLVETMLMSMLFEGRWHTFSPVTYLERMDLTLIRPLLYINESDVIGFRNKMNLPVVKSACPMDGHSKREYAKNLVKQLNREHVGARDRMFHAILNGDMEGWPIRYID